MARPLELIDFLVAEGEEEFTFDETLPAARSSVPIEVTWQAMRSLDRAREMRSGLIRRALPGRHSPLWLSRGS
jgi:hypothetical protein